MAGQVFPPHFLNSSDASDALNELGILGGIGGLKPITSPKPLEGYAMTVAVAPTREGYPSLRDGMLEASLTAKKDSLLFITTESPKYSAFGGLMSHIAIAAGIKGVVVCGKIRDLDEIGKKGLTVYANGATPLVPKEKQCVISIGKEVEFSGVRVRAGDYVICDMDGVSVIPFNYLHKVAELIKTKRKNEQESVDYVDLKISGHFESSKDRS